MNTYDAWELDSIIKRIESMESRVYANESEYDKDDFEYITEYLSRARKALHKAWLMV